MCSQRAELLCKFVCGHIILVRTAFATTQSVESALHFAKQSNSQRKNHDLDLANYTMLHNLEFFTQANTS